ncbi:MAG: cytochrome c family protein [Paracoccaceae bacterium]
MKTLLAAILATAALALGMAAAPVVAQSWTLDGDASRLAYGSIKKDTVGEVNSFESLSGTVSADGMAKIEIDLSSVQTNIDIRNERMIEHVFKGGGTATLSAQIDMADLTALAPGETSDTFADVTLSLLGVDVELEAELFVARLSEQKVMVTTNDLLFLSTADAGVDPAVDVLMGLAKLPGITRTVPVTLRLVFTQDEQKADAAAAAPTQVAAVAGDAKAGRKVFNKCKACHQLKEGKNGAGPSLHGIFGATAGSVEGFRYSKAMKESGIVWTADTMAEFMAAPKDVVPGNKMAFRGLKKEDDIANLLAYLAAETGS